MSKPEPILMFVESVKEAPDGATLILCQVGDGWHTNIHVQLPIENVRSVKGRHCWVDGGLSEPCRVRKFLPMPDPSTAKFSPEDHAL